MNRVGWLYLPKMTSIAWPVVRCTSHKDIDDDDTDALEFQSETGRGKVLLRYCGDGGSWDYHKAGHFVEWEEGVNKRFHLQQLDDERQHAKLREAVAEAVAGVPDPQPSV